MVRLDGRVIGEAIIDASNCSNQTIAIDSRTLVLCPVDGVVSINLKKLADLIVKEAQR